MNEEFAEQYGELYQENGFDGVTGIGPTPKTSWNPKPVRPTLGKNVQIEEFARVVGGVRIGSNSTVGERKNGLIKNAIY